MAKARKKEKFKDKLHKRIAEIKNPAQRKAAEAYESQFLDATEDSHTPFYDLDLIRKTNPETNNATSTVAGAAACILAENYYERARQPAAASKNAVAKRKNAAEKWKTYARTLARGKWTSNGVEQRFKCPSMVRAVKDQWKLDAQAHNNTEGLKAPKRDERFPVRDGTLIRFLRSVYTELAKERGWKQ